MKLLFIGDLHLGSNTFEKEQAIAHRLLERAAQVDMVILGGDMTDSGHPKQYDRLLSLYAPLIDKCIPLRGNHDMGAYMERIRPWIPADVHDLRFDPSAYPVWVWTTNWFQTLEANTKAFSFQQSLPPPYNRYAQPPVIVVQDGIGPYYSFTREGVKFIVLDSSTHRLGEKQQAWLTSEVANTRQPIIILIHQNILPMGSSGDSAILWDRNPVVEHLINNPLVLGVFSGHVHYNRIWDWQGKKIVTTAERGHSRFIEIHNGQITAIEAVDNALSGSRRKGADRDQSKEYPLEIRHWLADGVLAPDTFWCFSNDLWIENKNWGWYAPQGPGGLIWSVPPKLLPHRETWFGVNFRSTTPWELRLERDGIETPVQKGGPSDNIIATGSFGHDDHRPSRVILHQQAPACGHACCGLVLGNAPITAFNHYP